MAIHSRFRRRQAGAGNSSWLPSVRCSTVVPVIRCMPMNTAASAQLKMVGFHWMKSWLRSTSVAPPNTVTTANISSSRFSRWPVISRVSRTCRAVAAISTAVAV